MTITLQKLPDENIVVTSKIMSFDPAAMEQVFQEIYAMLETVKGRLCIIVDMRGFTLSFSQDDTVCY